jgi:hypothetical protein
MNKVIEADFIPRETNGIDAKAGFHTEGHSFLAKPVSIPELIEAIDEHLPVRAASHVSLPKERSQSDP